MMMTVKQLSFAIGRKQILTEVSAAFAAGRITAIIGPNGSGKSTLMSFLGKTRTSVGKVFFRGQDVSEISPHDYALKVSMLPQQRETIADFRVKDVVVMGRFPYKKPFRDYSADDRRIAAETMERVGVADMAERRISHMSGGEIQRVLIAKALAQEPELVLLDEPTNHLDVKYKVALMKTLRGYGKTAVMVLHDLSLAAEYADDVLVMKDGKTVSQGTARETMTTDLLEKVFGVPFVRYEQNGRVYLNY